MEHIIQIFKNFGFEIEIEMNLTKVGFLNVTFTLIKEKLQLHNK